MHIYIYIFVYVCMYVCLFVCIQMYMCFIITLDSLDGTSSTANARCFVTDRRQAVLLGMVLLSSSVSCSCSLLLLRPRLLLLMLLRVCLPTKW